MNEIHAWNKQIRVRHGTQMTTDQMTTSSVVSTRSKLRYKFALQLSARPVDAERLSFWLQCPSVVSVNKPGEFRTRRHFPTIVTSLRHIIHSRKCIYPFENFRWDTFNCWQTHMETILRTTPTFHCRMYTKTNAKIIQRNNAWPFRLLRARSATGLNTNLTAWYRQVPPPNKALGPIARTEYGNLLT